MHRELQEQEIFAHVGVKNYTNLSSRKSREPMQKKSLHLWKAILDERYKNKAIIILGMVNRLKRVSVYNIILSSFKFSHNLVIFRGKSLYSSDTQAQSTRRFQRVSRKLWLEIYRTSNFRSSLSYYISVTFYVSELDIDWESNLT